MKKIQRTFPATLFVCFVTVVMGTAQDARSEAHGKHGEWKGKSFAEIMAERRKKTDDDIAKAEAESKAKKEAANHKPIEWLKDKEGKVVERNDRKYPVDVSKLPSMGNIHKSIGALYIEKDIEAFKKEMSDAKATSDDIQKALGKLELYPKKWRKNKQTKKWFGWISHDDIKKLVAEDKKKLDDAFSAWKSKQKDSPASEAVKETVPVDALESKNAELEAAHKKLEAVQKQLDDFRNQLRTVLCGKPTASES